MAVASPARALERNWSQSHRVGGAEGDGTREQGGAVAQTNGIGSGKGGFAMGLRNMFSCLKRPITADDALPKLATIGHDHHRGEGIGEDLNLPHAAANSKVRACEVSKLDDCRMCVGEVTNEEEHLRDVEENYLSAREDVEGLCVLARYFLSCMLLCSCDRVNSFSLAFFRSLA